MLAVGTEIDSKVVHRKFRMFLSKKEQDKVVGAARRAGIREVQKVATKRGYGFDDRTHSLRKSMRGIGTKSKGKGIVKSRRNFYYLRARGDVKKRYSIMGYYAYVIEHGRKRRSGSSIMKARPFLRPALREAEPAAFRQSTKVFMEKARKALAKL